MTNKAVSIQGFNDYVAYIDEIDCISQIDIEKIEQRIHAHMASGDYWEWQAMTEHTPCDTLRKYIEKYRFDTPSLVTPKFKTLVYAIFGQGYVMDTTRYIKWDIGYYTIHNDNVTVSIGDYLDI